MDLDIDADLINRFEFNIDVDELNDNNPKISQPLNFNITLKDHQLTILHRCIEYENNEIYLDQFPIVTHNGTKYMNAKFKPHMAVIGDRVGSGKSYIALALIRSNDITTQNNTIIKSYGLNNVVYYIPDTKRVIKTNLLIIPHNLCTQWEQYIKRCYTDIKYKIVNRQKILDKILEPSFNIEEYELIVVTGTFYNKLANYIINKNIKLQRVIIDEVDNLNIPGCNNIDTCFIWFITASYANLLYPRGYSKYESNMHRRIWCATGLKNSGYIKNIFMDLFLNISRDFMKVLIIKNSEGYVQRSISLPPIFKFVIKCKTPNTIRILTGIVDRNIIECLNANDINSALQYINANHKGNEDNIINLLINKYNKQLTNINLNLTMTQQMIFENETLRLEELNKINAKINDIRHKIQLITDRVKNDNICTICFDETNDNRTVTQCCQNSFCFKCINTWLTKKPNCPLCKAGMTSDDYLVINKNFENTYINEIVPDENELNEDFDKYKNLKILLKKRKIGSKFLIFSSSDMSFHKIIPILDELNIRFDFLKGHQYHINNLLNNYNNSNLDVLLVNSTYYGSGLNIEKTSDIIMFHRFDNQMEQQIVGRADRMGRTEPLNIHYLLYQNELSIQT